MRQLYGVLGRKHTKIRVVFNGFFVLALIYFFYNSYDILGNSSKLYHRSNSNKLSADLPSICSGLFDHKGFTSSCEFLKAHPQCSLGGMIDYTKFYYCDCKKSVFAFLVLAIWLVALFYLLGNTATDYFCCSLEKLSTLLNISPSVAGVALLPLGNGAPDVFSSIAAFVGTGTGEVGLNSVLGGAVFITCVVVGTISICVANQPVHLDKKCFIRDIVFLIVTIMSLLFILFLGKVSISVAIAFVSIYAVYAFFVAANEILKKHVWGFKLPLRRNVVSHGDIEENINNPLLDVSAENSLPQCKWTSERSLWGRGDDDEETQNSWFSCSRVCSLLEFPLNFPRRLTIPLVEEETWSKFYAVASVTLAPILLAFLWNTQQNIGSKTRNVTYLVAILVGFVLGGLGYWYTKSDHPPRRFLLPWVVGGFLMSIVWFYMLANELVALLVGLGVILGVSPSILGLTVLAWGNSVGDLVSNVALAMNGGDGIQIAWSGCYAGPMFNTLIGLGLSMLFGALSEKPGPYILAQDNSLYWTLGFLVLGLVWALVLLLRNDMQPSRLLGGGLIAIYVIFLSVHSAIGVISFVGL